MAATTIRAAVPADGAALARAWTDGGRYYLQLNAELFQAPAGEPLVEYFTARLGDLDSDSVVFAAEIEGRRLAGSAQCSYLPMTAPSSRCNER